MNKYFHEDVHDENMDIAEKIHEDSQNVRIPKHQSFEELLNAFEKNEKSSKKFTKKDYRKFSKVAAIAACFLTIIAVGGVFAHFNPLQIGKDHKSSSKISDSTKVPRVANSYEDVYKVFRDHDEKNVSINYPYMIEENNSFIDYADGSSKNGSTTKTLKNGTSEKEYSKTNVQTENIDEADTIKTNGKYIFTFRETGYNAKEEIVISEVNRDSAKTVSTINISKLSNVDYDTFEGMYLYEDQLIVITSKYTTNALMEYIFDYTNYEYQTFIYTYDVSNAEKPTLLSTNKQDGQFVSSRMKGSCLYTVSNKRLYNNYYTYNDGCIPKINGQKETCGCIYIPEDISSKGFVVVTALDVENPDDYANSQVVVGDCDQIYASTDNLYIINNTYDYVDLKDSENPFKNKKITEKSYWNYDDYIYERIEERYPDVDIKKITKKVTRRDVREVCTIDIMKFKYSNGNIAYIAESTVEGQAYDNMFFDEKDGYLRFVASHNEEYEAGFQYEYYSKDNKLVYSYFLADDYETSKDDTTSKVAVLDKSLELCGLIEGLAKNEEIYSARYLGDYGYFVTFEQTDPLFTIDFSDMKNPKITSELKMPGYSSYLHFYSDDLLFGLGEEDIKGYSKIKLEMYDISKKDAKQKSKTYVGKTSKNYDYYSPALEDYKALLIDPEKNYIGFYYDEECYSNRDYDEYNHYVLYEYVDNEFQCIFDIKWNFDSDDDSGDYGDIRGFYIDNYFYIVDAASGIRIVNLDTYKKNPQVVYEKF